MSRNRSNPAQVRGDIQSGRTGDKRNGYDPAMAPLETDAEAAGTPMTTEQVELSRETQVQGDADRSPPEYSDAMRPPTPHSKPRKQDWPLRVGMAGCVIILVVLAYLLLHR